ncbi:hypothetical protein B0T11DRAFT_93461 [Plectosphaerella cucumerina]|uniref:Secreted protein n=1 Tax=Plectosphaerella cucumerina TaxID=40658 RepID=A0A8K0X450_9PEZI|nr:hypothetical protein B0T11DRAFT_93461 [Plectosphaerella cucumerina]
MACPTTARMMPAVLALVWPGMPASAVAFVPRGKQGSHEAHLSSPGFCCGVVRRQGLGWPNPTRSGLERPLRDPRLRFISLAVVASKPPTPATRWVSISTARLARCPDDHLPPPPLTISS